MRTEDFNLDELIEALTGTTESIAHFLPDGMVEEDLTEEEVQRIDEEIFLCATCGWWCEISENVESDDSELHCRDCKDEDSDDEDED
jgi:hypothetical protein